MQPVNRCWSNSDVHLMRSWQVKLNVLAILVMLGSYLSSGVAQLDNQRVCGSHVTLTPDSLHKCQDSTHPTDQNKWSGDGKDKNVKMTSNSDDDGRALHVSTGLLPGQRIRNSLARAVYFKMREDEENVNNRHVHWYRVIVTRLSPDMQSKFVQFEQDKGTDEFLESCTDQSNQIFTQLFYSLTRPILNLFMTQTSINGFLNRGSMFIFSRPQIEKFLNISPYQKWTNLLDLGAGDGKVTAVLSPYFHNTFATEISSVMVRRLRGHGYSVLGLDEWHTGDRKYDMIACLNLLDRCDRPMTLLANIKASLTESTGRLLLAVVIPFRQYVEFESRSHEPSEVIRVSGSNFEEELEQFNRLFNQAGFEVESFTRLPYLCEGDLQHSFYVLTDAIFLLKHKET